MHIICLTPLAPGVYNDHKADHITAPPDGWAYIPEDFPLPSTFPRLGSIKAKEMNYTRDAEIQKKATNGSNAKTETVTETVSFTMMTVTEMTEGDLPKPTAPHPSQIDVIEAQVMYTAMMTDTLLEV